MPKPIDSLDFRAHPKHYSKPEHAKLPQFRGQLLGGAGVLMVSLRSNLRRAVAENAALVIGVMKFGAIRTEVCAEP